MSDKSKPKNEDNKKVERRANRGGIREGGRRADDSRVVTRFSRSSRIWFALSMMLTASIMIWTFSIPFRTEKPIFAWDKSHHPQRPSNIAAEILAHPEHGMDSEQYLAFVYQLEEELQEELLAKNQVPENLPDAKIAEANRVKLMEKKQQELDILMDQAEDLDPDSIQAQAIQRLEKELNESED